MEKEVKTKYEVEVPSIHGNGLARDIFTTLRDLAWENNGGPIWQMGQRTFLDGRKDNFPSSSYFSFKNPEDARNFKQVATLYLACLEKGFYDESRLQARQIEDPGYLTVAKPNWINLR